MLLSENQINMYNECLLLESGSLKERLQNALKVIAKGRQVNDFEKELNKLIELYELPEDKLYESKTLAWKSVRTLFRISAINFAITGPIHGGALGAMGAMMGAPTLILTGAIFSFCYGFLSKLLRIAASEEDMKKAHKDVDACIADLQKQKKKLSEKDRVKCEKSIKALEKLKEDHPIKQNPEKYKF